MCGLIFEPASLAASATSWSIACVLAFVIPLACIAGSDGFFTPAVRIAASSSVRTESSTDLRIDLLIEVGRQVIVCGRDFGLVGG